jgi:hypothetical protein
MLEDQHRVALGQILGIVAGTRTKSGSTNFMRLHTVGDTDVPDEVRRKAARQFAPTKTAAPDATATATTKSTETKKTAKPGGPKKKPR